MNHSGANKNNDKLWKSISICYRKKSKSSYNTVTLCTQLGLRYKIPDTS